MKPGLREVVNGALAMGGSDNVLGVGHDVIEWVRVPA
jgi:hypothetical protein